MYRLVGLLFIFCAAQVFGSSEDYLKGRIPPNNARYVSMKLALDLLEARKAKVIVETGTSRSGHQGFIGEGSFTIILGDWARDHNSQLYSVDISPQSIQNAQNAIGNNDNVHLVCQDSVAFLEQFDQKIDFLYLDSFDFDFNNPYPSQEHHLKEIIAAYPKLAPNCVIMIDDCGLPHGGKGAMVISYLLDLGWSILYYGYQAILIK